MHPDSATIISILLDAGAKVNETDRDGRSVLSHAAVSSTEEVVITLIDAGADPNLADKNGWTPLQYAFYYDSSGYVDKGIIISHLLLAGAAADYLYEWPTIPVVHLNQRYDG